MGASVEAWTWNPLGIDVYDRPAPPHTDSPSSVTTPAAPSAPATGAQFQGRTTQPANVTLQPGSPLLPDDLATEGRSLAAKWGNDEHKDDPQAQVIDFSRLVQDVDGQLYRLADQPIDLDGARQKVVAADARQTQFLQQVYGGLKPQQVRNLESLAVKAHQAQGEQKQEAQASFFKAIDAVLTPGQRKTLVGLQRASEDARLDLQDQTIAKGIREARASGGTGSNNEALSLALADGRAFVAGRMQLQADRKVQDIYAIALSPQARQQLAQPQRNLLAATTDLQQQPSNQAAKDRLDAAKANFDEVFNSVVDARDREAIKGFEAYQQQMQGLAGTLGNEATAEHTFRDLKKVVLDGAPSQQQIRQYEVARADFALIKQNRDMRGLALRAANDESLNGQLDQAIVKGMRLNADLNVRHRQLDLELAKSASADGKLTPVSAGNSTVNGVPATQSVTEAQRLLDTAKTEQRDLEQSLKPPPPKRSFWDHALDIVASAGEVIGGVALMAFSGWTGVGAVAGGAIVVDGLFRLGHGISDAANGTTTDTPQSKLFQAFGASQQTANRIDTGVSIAATVPIAVGGAAITATRAASLIVKGVNVASAAMVLDGAQAQARYVATGEAVTPWTVDRLVAAGLSPTQANYALATGSIIATGAAAKVAARTAPATTTTATPAVATARATAPNVSVTPTSAATTTQVAGETTAPTAGSAQAALSANTTSSTGTANVSPTALPAAAGALLTDATSLTREPLAVVRSPHFADLEDVAPSSDPRPRQATLEQQRVHRTNGAGGSRPVNPSSGAGSAEPRATSPAGYKIGEITYRTDPSDPVRHRAPTDVAILGGGNVGFTLAADLALNSEFRPTLLFRGDGTGADRITPVTGAYTFNETLHGSTHTVNLRPEHFGYMDTLRGAQAMQEAKTIVVTIPDAPQSRLALFNHLQNAGLVDDPAKTIVLIRAGQAGQPALSQIIRENSGWKASVVLVEDSPYGTRVSHDPSGHVINGKRKDNVEISVLGEKGEQTPGLTAMREMFPLGEQISRPSWPDFTVVPGIEMPWRAGYFIHPGPAFDPVNLQKTARGEQYLHYSEGVHPELGERLQRIDQERVELAAAYGVRGETFPEKLERQFGLERRPEETFYETMQRTRDIYKSKSYPSLGTLLKSRYPQEDVPGLFTINWFARRANVDLPEHGAFEAHIRSTLQELGMPAWEIENNLGGYLPILHATEGGVPEITQLLDAPHIRPEA